MSRVPKAPVLKARVVDPDGSAVAMITPGEYIPDKHKGHLRCTGHFTDAAGKSHPCDAPLTFQLKPEKCFITRPYAQHHIGCVFGVLDRAWGHVAEKKSGQAAFQL